MLIHRGAKPCQSRLISQRMVVGVFTLMLLTEKSLKKQPPQKRNFEAHDKGTDDNKQKPTDVRFCLEKL